MKPHQRRRFDRAVEDVLRDLPAKVREMIEEVPVVVEDRPSEDVMEEEHLDGPDDLCGLYTGVPLIERGLNDSDPIGDRITLYREALLDEARDEDGRLDPRELRRQIRLTILHEMGHHFGLDENDLDKLGYG